MLDTGDGFGGVVENHGMVGLDSKKRLISHPIEGLSNVEQSLTKTSPPKKKHEQTKEKHFYQLKGLKKHRAAKNETNKNIKLGTPCHSIVVSGVVFKTYELSLFTPFKFHINIAFWKVRIFPFCQGHEKSGKHRPCHLWSEGWLQSRGGEIEEDVHERWMMKPHAMDGLCHVFWLISEVMSFNSEQWGG